MAPKKGQQAAKPTAKKDKKNGIPDSKAETNGSSTEAKPANNKRKAASSNTSPPKKVPRRQGTRTSSRTNASDSTRSSPTPKQLLNFLLSSAAIPLAYPADEVSSTDAKTYAKTSPAAFTPFEHLLTCSLLSKPLSHRLGMRSTRTLLNPPFALNSPEEIVRAGEHRVWEALEAARTQHRQKTAAYIYQMAESVEMGKLKEVASAEGVDGVVREVKRGIKGMAVTGAELFCRRIQCVEGWGDAIWPFADARGLEALRDLGMEIEDAEDVQSMIERDVDWNKVGDMGIAMVDELEMDQQIRVEFVVLLERAIGASLEGNIDEVRKAAMG